ncbi:MAG TPA: permease-like cell division protein FtsX [Candidatus Acidoferrales bacterium]|nr:permease-like cell division protein FtsX [Candidatus Acidoferrales bacterium]
MRPAHVLFIARRVARNLKDFLGSHLLASATVATALFIFGGFLLLQQNLYGLLKSWGNQAAILAYLDDDLSAAEVKALFSEVRSFPEVDSVRYISREKAWEEFKKSLGQQGGLLEGLERDVLPASLEISVKPEYRADGALKALAARLERAPGIGEVEYPAEWVERLNGFFAVLRWAQWSVGAVLFGAALVIARNTARLAILARRDEIEILKLVGATGALVKAPFVLEGMIQGTLGALLALAVLALLFVAAGGELAAALGSFLPADELRFLDVEKVGLLLAIGWALGAGGSFFAARKFV